MNSSILPIVFIASIVTNFLGATYTWSERTRKDLEALQIATKQYSATNINQSVLQECIKRSSLAKTLSDYQAILSYYLSGFHNNMFTLTWHNHPKKVCWQNFIITYQHDAYIVAYTSNRCSKNMLPPKGAELIACDGIPIASYITDYIEPYNWHYNSNPKNKAVYIGMYDNHQWAHKISYCTYLYEGKQISIPVLWNWRSYSRLHKHFDTILKEQSNSITTNRQRIKEIQLPSKCAILTINK